MHLKSHIIIHHYGFSPIKVFYLVSIRRNHALLFVCLLHLQRDAIFMPLVNPFLTHIHVDPELVSDRKKQRYMIGVKWIVFYMIYHQFVTSIKKNYARTHLQFNLLSPLESSWLRYVDLFDGICVLKSFCQTSTAVFITYKKNYTYFFITILVKVSLLFAKVLNC